MARRQLLNDVQWAGLLSPPAEEREIVRHYTLGKEDLAAAAEKRGDHNRIGFALTLCYLRFPGRVLAIGETPPLPMIRFVARQLRLEPEAFAAYARRDQTRREHLAELSRSLGCKPFERPELQALIGWLTPMAHKPRAPEQLVPMLIDELRRRRILLPPAGVLELIVHQARSRAESTLHRVLVDGLSASTRASLDGLLEQRPEEATTYLAWLRSAQQSPAARNLLGLTGRVRFVRTLGIDRARRQDIPAQAFERLADEGLRMTAQHLRDLTGPRRHAVLCATVIKLESLLTDAALSMFDKLMGSVARKASRRNDERTLQSAREVRARIAALTKACRAVIAARESGPIRSPRSSTMLAGRLSCVQLPRPRPSLSPLVNGDKVELVEKYPSVRHVCADAARHVSVPGRRRHGEPA